MQQVKRETSQPNKSHLHPITTVAMDELRSELNFPGFRFHPTEEELLDFYLKKMALGKNMRLDIIGFLNIYRHDPWDLPGLAKIGEREWYFFVPRDKRHGSGGRPNRTTENGFWKATGSDRKIFGLSDPKRQLGLKKTLVFYKGRAPRGTKTDWVMNEYRLLDSCPLPKDIVLCKIYRKATSLKVLEQRAAMEEEITKSIHHHNDHHAHTPPSPILPPMDTMSFSSHNYDGVLPDPPPMTAIHVASITKAIHHHHHDHAHNPPSPITPSMDTMSFSSQSQNYDDLLPPDPPMTTSHVASITKEEDQDQDFEVTVEEKLKDEAEESDGSINTIGLGTSLKLPGEIENLGGLQVQLPKFNMDWTQDSFWTQLRSPWLDNLSLTPYANILNF